jgi:peptide-methionine (S)-S-oxide reductase
MKSELATFGGGCFWCTEAVFKRVMGVSEVVSGYSGGARENPSYDQVSTGATGHAEAVQISFDPATISYDTLLDIFFAVHDPTTLNRQGADAGTQYRSVIFYHTDEQKAQADKKMQEKAGKFSDPIVTEVLPFEKFYTAEEYHQNYYDANPLAPYCSVVIAPKVRKLLEKYGTLVKEEYKNKS